MNDGNAPVSAQNHPSTARAIPARNRDRTPAGHANKKSGVDAPPFRRAGVKRWERLYAPKV
jgi:hypothetical protein